MPDTLCHPETEDQSTETTHMLAEFDRYCPDEAMTFEHLKVTKPTTQRLRVEVSEEARRSAVDRLSEVFGTGTCVSGTVDGQHVEFKPVLLPASPQYTDEEIVNRSWVEAKRQAEEVSVRIDQLIREECGELSPHEADFVKQASPQAVSGAVDPALDDDSDLDHRFVEVGLTEPVLGPGPEPQPIPEILLEEFHATKAGVDVAFRTPIVATLAEGLGDLLVRKDGAYFSFITMEVWHPRAGILNMRIERAQGTSYTARYAELCKALREAIEFIRDPQSNGGALPDDLTHWEAISKVGLDT